MWLNSVLLFCRERFYSGQNFLKRIALDPEKFRKIFRLDAWQFDNILGEVFMELYKEPDRLNKPLTPDIKLAICLR